MTTVASPTLGAAVAAYARRFHAAVGSEHHVGSPLGAWIVLALVAEAAEGAEAERLAEVLGMQAPEAAGYARWLLDRPHPVVAAAAAAWTRDTPTAAAERWVAGLPDAVERGPVPSQAAADAWAREHTFGLIETFPLDVAKGWSCVLASALATRVSWSVPFDTAGADAFRSGWRHRVARVLRTPRRGHECAIVRHPDVGDVALHRARSEGLVVTSVIAAPDVPADRVLAAAHDLAGHRGDRRSLFDLAVGDGHAWTVTESDGEEGEERLVAVLPAWSATSDHDLSPAAFGFADAAAVLGRLFDAPDWEARQAATARYDRVGFEAAAVTVVAARMSFRPPQRGRQRDALLRFDRPYAVVANAVADGESPWSGLPVFSAWVAEPQNARD
ncbi:MAG TPA: hypothetical protein VFY38_12210 [Pseudonocardia sp.]|nr:hypothetical protein [Pseudonocardia sp.]